MASSLCPVRSECRHDAICVVVTHFIQPIVGIMREVGRGHFHAFTLNHSQSFYHYTGLFISSGISELDCATTKTDTAERSISIGGESLQVFLVLGALAYFQVPPLGGSREEKWRSQ